MRHKTKGAIEQLNEILEKAIVSEPLKNAIKEAIIALEGGNSELAYELTAVKSLVTGEEANPEVNHFRENIEQNRSTLGRSVYALLDSIHHDLAFGLGKIPSGMMILYATGGMREKAESEKQHPVITRIQEERAAIQRKART